MHELISEVMSAILKKKASALSVVALGPEDLEKGKSLAQGALWEIFRGDNTRDAQAYLNLHCGDSTDGHIYLLMEGQKALAVGYTFKRSGKFVAWNRSFNTDFPEKSEFESLVKSGTE
jgi:hypothetical protein